MIAKWLGLDADLLLLVAAEGLSLVKGLDELVHTVKLVHTELSIVLMAVSFLFDQVLESAC